MAELQRLGILMVGATPGVPAGGETTVAKYVRGGDIREDGLSVPSDGPAPTRGREARLAADDIVVRSRGLPVAARISAGIEGAYPSNDVLLFRPDRSKVDPGYVATFLNLPSARQALSVGSQGAALSRLSVQALGNLQIPLPSLEMQRKIAVVAECMETEQRLLERLRELRRQLTQEILQRLLGNAHDEGGNPRRGSHQADRPKRRPVSPHLEVRNS